MFWEETVPKWNNNLDVFSYRHLEGYYLHIPPYLKGRNVFQKSHLPADGISVGPLKRKCVRACP